MDTSDVLDFLTKGGSNVNADHIRLRNVFHEEVNRGVKYEAGGYIMNFHFNVRGRLFEFRVVNDLRDMFY